LLFLTQPISFDAAYNEISAVMVWPALSNREYWFAELLADVLRKGSRERAKKPMTAINPPDVGQIRALLAERGYEVTETAPNTLKVREVDSGVSVQGVLEGDILYFSLVCTVVPKAAVTADAMRKMLAAENGISTSYFQLYDAAEGKIAITLNNFCKLQDLGADDADDILSCVHFLLVDVMSARDLVGHLDK
jgi:hypothetical protein